MLVFLVEALHVGNCVVGTEACQRVDVAVGVVTGEVAVVEPQDAFRMKCFEQSGLNLFLCERLVAMWRKQTFACSQDGPFAVALDASSLEDEIEMAFVRPF